MIAPVPVHCFSITFMMFNVFTGYNIVCKLVIREFLCQVFIKIERGSEGDPSPQTQQGALFCMKTGDYQCFEVCWSETGSCASKPL